MHVSDGIALNHLDRMTDSTGLIQHAIYSIPRRESGYTTDDNARALRLCARLWGQQPGGAHVEPGDDLSELLGACPLASAVGSTIFSVTSATGWMPKARGDCQGQAVRALAEVLGSSLPDGLPRVGPRVDRRGSARAGRPAEPAGAGVRDPGVGASVDVRG